jgi:hypothetical protein
MKWNVNDENYPTRIVEGPDLLDLKDWMTKNQCRCKVSLNQCEPNFWRTEDERRRYVVTGCYGPRGFISPEEAAKWKLRPIMDSKQVIVNIQFIMSTKNAEKIKNTKLELTPNNVGEYLNMCMVYPSRERIPYTCGVYKREGFDDAYNALKVLKPNLTEEEFARNNKRWDLDLVECRLFDGMDKCIETSIQDEVVDVGKSQVYMTLLEIDIKKNMEFIKTILTAYC